MISPLKPVFLRRAKLSLACFQCKSVASPWLPGVACCGGVRCGCSCPRAPAPSALISAAIRADDPAASRGATPTVIAGQGPSSPRWADAAPRPWSTPTGRARDGVLTPTAARCRGTAIFGVAVFYRFLSTRRGAGPTTPPGLISGDMGPAPKPYGGTTHAAPRTAVITGFGRAACAVTQIPGASRPVSVHFTGLAISDASTGDDVHGTLYGARSVQATH